MARKKNKVPSFRVRLDGNIPQPCVDPREQKALDWYKENSKNRMAFPIAWSFIVAAVNGELGPQVQKAVSDGNTAEAIDALQDLLGAFGDPSPDLSPNDEEQEHHLERGESEGSVMLPRVDI